MNSLAMEYSVVTALYNGLEYTRAYIDSLDATLSGIEYELILVDDCSTDGTREFLATLKDRPNTQVLLNEENMGFARSNNFGGHHANGKYLLFLNNDLILNPGWLEPMVEAMQGTYRWNNEERKAGLVGNVQRRVESNLVDHAGIFIDTFGQPQHAFASSEEPPKAKTHTWLALTAACWMVEKKLFYDIGAFNEIYVNGCEDVDFCLKMLDAGYVNVCANRSEVLHHVSASRGHATKDAKNFDKLWNLWRGPLQERSHIDSIVLWWRMASPLEKLKHWKKSLHALTTHPSHFPRP